MIRIGYFTPLILVTVLSGCGHRPANIYQTSYYSTGLSTTTLADQNRLTLQTPGLNSSYQYTVNEDNANLNANATTSTKKTGAATKVANKSKKTSSQTTTSTKKSTTPSPTGSKTVAKLSSHSSLADLMPTHKVSGAVAVSLK